jgi:hypothetical protein
MIDCISDFPNFESSSPLKWFHFHLSLSRVLNFEISIAFKLKYDYYKKNLFHEDQRNSTMIS